MRQRWPVVSATNHIYGAVLGFSELTALSQKSIILPTLPLRAEAFTKQPSCQMPCMLFLTKAV